MIEVIVNIYRSMDKKDAKMVLRKNKNGIKDILVKFCNKKIPKKISEDVDAINEVIVDFFKEFNST